MKVKLRNVRLAFPQLFKATAVNGEGEPAYSASFILDPLENATDMTVLNAVVEEVAKSKWGAKAGEVLKTLRAKDMVCLHNGDTKAEYEGYAGNFFVSARNRARPTVIDRDKTPLTEADGKPYAGCYVDAVVELWAQDNKFGKRVNASLSGVQFRRDGEAFSGGRPASSDDFDDLAVQEEEELV